MSDDILEGEEIELVEDPDTGHVTKVVISTPELSWSWLHNYILDYKKRRKK